MTKEQLLLQTSHLMNSALIKGNYKTAYNLLQTGNRLREELGKEPLRLKNLEAMAQEKPQSPYQKAVAFLENRGISVPPNEEDAISLAYNTESDERFSGTSQFMNYINVGND